MAKSTVDLIPLERIERQEEGGEVEIHVPGPDAQPFTASAKEAERLIRVGAARRAHVVEEGQESGEGGGESKPKPAAKGKAPAKAKPATAPKGDAPAGDNPSIVE